MIEDQSTIWQIAYISEPRIIVELLIQKKQQKLLYEYHQSNFLYSKQRQTDKLSRLSFFDLQ